MRHTLVPEPEADRWRGRERYMERDTLLVGEAIGVASPPEYSSPSFKDLRFKAFQPVYHDLVVLNGLRRTRLRPHMQRPVNLCGRVLPAL